MRLHLDCTTMYIFIDRKLARTCAGSSSLHKVEKATEEFYQEIFSN